MCSKIVFWWCWGHVSLIKGCLMLEPVSCWTCCRRSAARAREHGQQSHAEKQMVVISHERPWWGTTVCGNTVQRQRHYHMEQKGGAWGGCTLALEHWRIGQAAWLWSKCPVISDQYRQNTQQDSRQQLQQTMSWCSLQLKKNTREERRKNLWLKSMSFMLSLILLLSCSS